MDSESLKEAVSKGASLLDKRHPGWYTKINLPALRMDDCVQCILGQLYGDYAQGLLKIKAIQNEKFEFGFSISPFDSRCKYEHFSTLNHLWKEEINHRLSKDSTNAN